MWLCVVSRLCYDYIMNAHDTVKELPSGYRWANSLECDRWNHPAYFNRMVQVRVGGTDFDPQTDLAIRG